jgi:hypothetical protein
MYLIEIVLLMCHMINISFNACFLHTDCRNKLIHFLMTVSHVVKRPI